MIVYDKYIYDENLNLWFKLIGESEVSLYLYSKLNVIDKLKINKIKKIYGIKNR
jgi:hypothetical protein